MSFFLILMLFHLIHFLNYHFPIIDFKFNYPYHLLLIKTQKFTLISYLIINLIQYNFSVILYYLIQVY